VIAEAVAGAAGVAVIAGSLVWRGRSRRAAVRQVRLALLDPDPATRRAAVYLASERGLAPYADLLLERTRQEHDKAVLEALGEAVARNQWEPADAASLVDLRVWARRHEAARPVESNDGEGVAVSMLRNGNGGGGSGDDHRRRAARTAAPRPVPQTDTVVLDAVAAIRQSVRLLRALPARVGGQGLLSAAPATPAGASPVADRQAPATTRAPSRRRPSPATVLVTGAGGPAGVSVIRALAAGGHRAVAADSDALAVGLRLGAERGVLPRADDDTFVERLCELARQMGATALVPTVAEELVTLAEASEDLSRAGLAHWLPSPSAVRACTDKWRFARVLVEHGIAGPATQLGSAGEVPGDWIVKPRFGRGSRDVVVVEDADDMAWALARVPHPIVQTRLRGREFTVDALVDRNAVLAGAVPRWRLETKAGISTKGRTFEDKSLVREVGQVLAAVGLQGPANVQGFVDDDGEISFMEVNPRFSGGLPLSLAAGADLVGEYVRGILGHSIRPERLAFKPGVTMLRHFEEVFE
jgi:carbamoyl-phosphate synthase large subunit